MSESMLRFPREDLVLMPPRPQTHGSAFVLIRAKRNADRRLAVRTLQGRGAVEVDVLVVPLSACSAPRTRATHQAAAA